MHEKDLDLLNFRDIKGNSAFHLAIKTRQQDTTSEFLTEKIFDYIPGSNEDGRKLDKEKAKKAQDIMFAFNIKLASNLKKRLDVNTLYLIGEGGYKYVFSVDDKKIGKSVALYTIKKPTPGYDEIGILK